MKAAVLPEPVTAPPTTSRPSNAIGMVFCWIGVGTVKDRDARPRRIGRERDMDWNEVTEWLAVSDGAKKDSRRACSSGSSLSSTDDASVAWSSGCGTGSAVEPSSDTASDSSTSRTPLGRYSSSLPITPIPKPSSARVSSSSEAVSV